MRWTVASTGVPWLSRAQGGVAEEDDVRELKMPDRGDAYTNCEVFCLVGAASRRRDRHRNNNSQPHSPTQKRRNTTTQQKYPNIHGHRDTQPLSHNHHNSTMLTPTVHTHAIRNVFTLYTQSVHTQRTLIAPYKPHNTFFSTCRVSIEWHVV